MKKIFCLFVITGVTAGLYAFDRSLNGSWGIVKDEEKTEVEEDGEFFLIQYHLLSSNKLLFIMAGESDFSDTITLILSRL